VVWTFSCCSPLDVEWQFLPCGSLTLSVQKTAETWAKLDQCTPKPTHKALPPKDKHGMKTRVDSCDDCRDGTEVALYSIDGGGNTWPSGDEF